MSNDKIDYSKVFLTNIIPGAIIIILGVIIGYKSQVSSQIATIDAYIEDLDEEIGKLNDNIKSLNDNIKTTKELKNSIDNTKTEIETKKKEYDTLFSILNSTLENYKKQTTDFKAKQDKIESKITQEIDSIKDDYGNINFAEIEYFEDNQLKTKSVLKFNFNNCVYISEAKKIECSSRCLQCDDY